MDRHDRRVDLIEQGDREIWQPVRNGNSDYLPDLSLLQASSFRALQPPKDYYRPNHNQRIHPNLPGKKDTPGFAVESRRKDQAMHAVQNLVLLILHDSGFPCGFPV